MYTVTTYTTLSLKYVETQNTTPTHVYQGEVGPVWLKNILIHIKRHKDCSINLVMLHLLFY